jgi:hypothetical protein
MKIKIIFVLSSEPMKLALARWMKEGSKRVGKDHAGGVK